MILHGDCLEILPTLAACSIDAIVTDPPYHLTSPTGGFSHGTHTDVYRRFNRGFMGQQWDGGDIAFRPDVWRECLRVLKPGGHMVVFGGTRTHHRLWCAIEDAGFEIRDCLMWLHGQGFAKSHDVSKAIDKHLGKEREVVGITSVTGNRRSAFADLRQDSPSGVYGDGGANYATAPAPPEAQQWQGFGSALKPAYEPILLARKPLDGTIAQNVLKHGVGGLNIDVSRVSGNVPRTTQGQSENAGTIYGADQRDQREFIPNEAGRWPPNILLDGSDEVTAMFPQTHKAGNRKPQPAACDTSIFGIGEHEHNPNYYDDAGSAARFFPHLDDEQRFLYQSKANKRDRAGSSHPTVKPIKLLEWLCRLITPPGGTILDPFAGSGTTGQAAANLGFNSILIEREAEYIADIERRLAMFL